MALSRRWLWPPLLIAACTAPSLYAETHYVYADVVGVERISAPYQPPYQQCTQRSKRKPVASLLGGVLGGLLGSQLGGGSGRTALTLVGAVAGAALAGRHRRSESVVCAEANAGEEYRVWYSYHGQEFSKRVSGHPGERVLVAVDVEPMPREYAKQQIIR